MADDPDQTSPQGYRTQLTRGDDVVDPATWAGSVPQAQGIAPRVRIGRYNQDHEFFGYRQSI